MRKPPESGDDIMVDDGIAEGLATQRAGQFEGAIVLTGAAGNFGGAGDDLGVAGAHGEVGPCIRAELGVAALEGEFADQCLEDGARQAVFATGLRRGALAGGTGGRVAGTLVETGTPTIGVRYATSACSI